MKKILLSIVAAMMFTGSLFAAIDRYKTDIDVDHTINHITYELPFYYAKDRTNLMGVYTLATNVGGKSSGTLSFDFKETENAFSRELRMSILRVAKDIHDSQNPDITISFTLSSGEKLYFDGSYFMDWNKNEWNQLLHVTYDRETKIYRSYIMFPLEYMKSNARSMARKSADRYKYVLKALSKNDIVLIQITDESRNAHVKIDIPIDRPTAQTMNDMINHKLKSSTSNKKNKKNKVENGKIQSGRR